MRKNKGALLALAGVLVILSALLLFLRGQPVDSGESGEESDYALAPVYQLEQPVRSLEIARGGESYTLLSLAVDAAQAEETPSSTLAGLENIPLDTPKINAVLRYAASLSYTELLFQSVEDYGPFGLDAPRARVTVTAMDGEAVTFLIGDVAAAGDGVYLRLEGEDAVYLVPAYLLDNYLLAREDYLSHTITPASGSPAPQRITLGGRFRAETGETVIERDREGYRLTAPFSHKAGQGCSNLVSTLFSLQAGGIALIEPDPFDLKAVGLDDPYATVTVTGGEESFSLAFSQPDAAGTLYIFREGVPLLYMGQLADYEWIRVSPYELMDPNAHAPALEDLSEIAVETEDRTYRFAVDTAGDQPVVSFEGAVLDGENFDVFYRTLTAARLEEITAESPGEEGPPVLVYGYRHRDGREHRVAFYDGPARRYYIRADEGEFFLISSLYVEKVLADLPLTAQNQPVSPWAG